MYALVVVLVWIDSEMVLKIGQDSAKLRTILYLLFDSACFFLLSCILIPAIITH